MHRMHPARPVEYDLSCRRQAAKPDAIATLSALPGVMVIPVTPELKARQEHSRIWNETWLAAFFHKPCNHELFVHQSLNMEGAAVWPSACLCICDGAARPSD